MKLKLLTGLGVLVLALGVFFFTNTTVNTSSDIKLASLIALNNANAECAGGSSPYWNTGVCMIVSNTCRYQSECHLGGCECAP